MTGWRIPPADAYDDLPFRRVPLPRRVVRPRRRRRRVPPWVWWYLALGLAYLAWLARS